MARKVLISFLGTGRYGKCRYFFNESDKNLPPTRYIQESILRIFCSDFSNNDVAYFFVTDLADKKNWQNNLEINEEEGLETCLKKIPFSSYIKKPIIDGKNEKEIWEIFSVISNEIRENDEIIIDITHAFRFLPMLNIVLCDYLKFVKNIKVKGIYYGNYDSRDDLGNAPIVNLTSFSILQDWTNGANDFIKYGFSSDFKKLLGSEYKDFTDALENVTDSINTNRGKRIFKGEIFKKLRQSIEKMTNLYPPPLKDIVSKISKKIESFEDSKNWKNGLNAVKWCIEHKLVQQGITILEELITTYICEKVFTKEKDIYDAYKRGLVSKCHFVKDREKPMEEWHNDLKLEANKEYIEKIFDILKDDLTKLITNISKIRNDINHSGYTSDNDPDKFYNGLEDCYNQVVSILN